MKNLVIGGVGPFLIELSFYGNDTTNVFINEHSLKIIQCIISYGIFVIYYISNML